MRKLPKYAKILKVPESEQKTLSLLRNLQDLPFDMQREDGLQFVQSKEIVAWINKKAKEDKLFGGDKNKNYYAFNRRDFTPLNQLLNEIALRQQSMEQQGYDLSGLRSFNRNIWLDLSRESNAIEGIMDDFSFDLLDLRNKIRSKIAFDPENKDFDKDEYFLKLSKQYQQLDKTQKYKIYGNKKVHEFSMDTIRHFMAFKYVYKCAKQDRNKKISELHFLTIMQNAAALLSGQDFVPFRQVPVYIQQVVETKFVPVKHETVPTKMDELLKFVCGPEGGRLNPIELAAIFHAEFVRIHPYMDGNGRTARIMSNYILIKNEIPTVALRHESADKYMLACNKAILTHEADDLIDIFYNAALSSAQKTVESFDYVEKTQHPKKTDEKVLKN